MADLSITAANVLASATATTRREYTAGATITAGQQVYLNASNQWVLGDCNAAATGNGVSDMRGVALHGASSGQPLAVVTNDSDFTPGATLTVGQVYVVSGTAGAIAPISDLLTGDYPTVLGVAKSASKLNLQPVAGGTQKP